MRSVDRHKGLNASSPTDKNLQEKLDETSERFSDVHREIVSIKDNVQRLQNTMNQSFESVFSKLKDMKEDGEKHTNELQDLKKDLEKKFKDLCDLIV